MSCKRIVVFYVTVAVLFGAAWIVSVDYWRAAGDIRLLGATIGTEIVTAWRVWRVIFEHALLLGIRDGARRGVTIYRQSEALHGEATDQAYLANGQARR